MNTRRKFRPEIRAVDGSNGRQFWAKPLSYEVVDDYGTIWTRGVFDASVREKMPVLLYGHDWAHVTNVLGRAIDYRDSEDGPRTLFELTDFDEHPHTRQVAAQINDGTLVDMSVGFDRRRWQGPGGESGLAVADRELRGPTGAKPVERMLEAGWDETSLVVAGAVPGSKVLTGVRSVRTASGLVVPTDSVVDLARLQSEGKITHDEAVAALRLLAGEAPSADDDPVAGGADDDDGQDDAEVLAEVDAALEVLDG